MKCSGKFCKQIIIRVKSKQIQENQFFYKQTKNLTSFPNIDEKSTSQNKELLKICMTSQYIAVIEEQLDTKYPQHQQQQTLTLQNIRFKIFLPKTTLMLNQYQNLRTLNINHCDLRNLDNFPKIYSLEQLDLGHNQIQDTFNNLMPLKKLKYLNIQHNLIFESIKLAPLRKIASANSNSQDKNQNKISVCIRNNPFIQQDTPYLIKFKNYGLKVIKQPKEYFDKKKQDDQKQTKSKSSAKKGKKSKQSLTKSNEKKKKLNWYQQSSQDSSLVSHPSPIVRPQINNDHHQSNANNNFNNPSSNNMGVNIDRRPISHEDRMQYLRMSRNNIADNFRGQHGRLLVRMGSNRGQVMSLEDQPFFNLDLIDDEDQINEMRDMFEDEDSDSDDIEEQDRLGNGQLHNQEPIQERIRLIERRNARFQQMRQLHRQNRLQRQRLRLQRRQQQRQNQLLRRRIQYQRRREERELLRRQEERQRLREQERQLIRRLSQSSRGRNMFLDGLPSNLGTRISSNNSDSSNPLQNSVYSALGGLRRPMGYRESLQRRLIASTSIAESNNPNDLSNRSIGSLIPPLRVRPSEDLNSNIIHLQRASSVSSNPNQILFGSDNNERMQVFNNGIDSYSDQDDDENDQENIQDPDDEEDQEMHICDSNCQGDHFQREEEQEDEQNENEEPLGLQVLPILDVNGNVVDYDDSGIERFIDDMGDNPNILRQNINGSDQSSNEFNYVLNSYGAPSIRRNNNQPSNLSSQPRNPQPESQMPQDEENSSSG